MVAGSAALLTPMISNDMSYRGPRQLQTCCR
jgi:hypothetical protein